VDKIERNKADIIELEEDGVSEAEIVVVTYGIAARVARIAVEQAREEGIRVGLLRLITVWPFPDDRIREIARRVGTFVVPEVNFGQIALEVERCAGGQAATMLVAHLGGGVHAPQTILDAIKRAVGK
jgi:2-oxoglutarate ferredoxin oxidoreductase subunit alpha